MVKILFITTANLDGFTAGAVMSDIIAKNRALNPNEEISIESHHVSYPDLATVIEHTLNPWEIVAAPYDMFLIVGLNPSREIWETIERHAGSYRVLTYCTHFNLSDEKQNILNRIATNPGNTVDVMKSSYVPTPRSSAYALLMSEPANVVDRYQWMPLLERTHAWTIHDGVDTPVFRHGQLMADVIIDIQNIVSGSLSDRQINDLMVLWISEVAKKAPVLYVSPQELDAHYRQQIPKALIPLCGDQYDALLSDMIPTLGFRQAMSLLAAAMLVSADSSIKEYPISTGDVVRVYISSKRMSMSIVHHLIYSLNAADVVIIPKNPRQVEMRQNQERSFINLSELAETLGGGGHRNAAGFPFNSQRWETVQNRLNDAIGQYLYPPDE